MTEAKDQDQVTYAVLMRSKLLRVTVLEYANIVYRTLKDKFPPGTYGSRGFRVVARKDSKPPEK